MSFAIICILFYLIGSFPTAFIVVKLRHKKNITEEGSGNAGARNTFEVTNSKLDGILVLVIDFLKGLLPVLWFFSYSEFEPQTVLLPSLLLIAGHNYSVWLKFKGGRGLATAAGIMIAINFTLVIIWLVLYFVLNKIIKNVHVSTVIALMLLPLSIIVFGNFILKFNNSFLSGIENPFQFLFSICSSICIIILLKHINPVIELLKQRSIKN